MRKKRVQEIKSNTKSNDERKCNPKINIHIQYSLLPVNHSLNPGLLKGRRFFNALGTRCFGFATTKSLEVNGTVSLQLGTNSGTRCFGFVITKSLEVIGNVSSELGINSAFWSVDMLGSN